MLESKRILEKQNREQVKGIGSVRSEAKEHTAILNRWSGQASLNR